MRRGLQLGLSTPILSSTSQYLPHPSRQQFHSSSHQAKHLRVHLDHSLPFITHNQSVSNPLGLICKICPKSSPFSHPHYPGPSCHHLAWIWATASWRFLPHLPALKSQEAAKVTFWKPSLHDAAPPVTSISLGIKAKVCLMAYKVLVSSPWTSAPTHHLYFLLKNPLLLLQQSGRLCIFCSFCLEPSSPRNPHSRSFLPQSFCFSVGPSLTILFKVCPLHISYPLSLPYFSPKQF